MRCELMRIISVALLWRAVDGQISGADCSYVSPDDPDAKLCLPKFCAAPRHLATRYEDPYIFHGLLSNNKYQVMNFTPPENMHGYDLQNICGDHIQNANPIAICQGADCPPSPPPPPLYSRASTAPRGCAAISPLPTLLQAVDLDLVAVWCILIVLLFYALAMVCEEFLVPAINILCVKTGIPDDVAGATLLAAGCNSPEFFASIIGIFVADSTVGVGTVIGSAPFNLCCITGGAALAMGGNLYLDPWLMARELWGLCTTFLLFLLFMADYRVEWWEALIMVLFYCCLYVPLLAHFDKFKAMCLRWVMPAGRATAMLGDQDNNSVAIAYVGSTPSNKQVSEAASTDANSSPYDNFGGGIRGSIAASLSHSLAVSKTVSFATSEIHAPHAQSAVPSDAGSGLSIELQARTIGDTLTASHSDGTPPTAHSRLVDDCRRRCEAYPGADGGFAGLLLKKPRGFTKVRVRGILWQMRYFVLDHHPTNPLRYSHADQKTKFVTLPLQNVTAVERVGADELHLISPTQVYTLRLPAGEPPEVMQRWFDHIMVKIDDLASLPRLPATLEGEKTEEEDDEHEHPPWYQMPDSVSGRVIHVCTFFIKAMVFTTTPNVLLKKNEKYYFVTIMMSMFWLAIFAMIMTDVVEYLGCGIGIDPTVMGLSLGAVGTSFPNLYASILVARQGQGGMAICQAIASNTFNICICLGLLWLLHTVGLGSCDYGSHGQLHSLCGGCYSPSGFKPLCPFWEGTNNAFGSASGSTKGAVIISFVWVAFFLAVLLVCKLHVRKVPAYIMFGIYLLYILYQFVAAFAPAVTICFRSVNICI